jgi:C1A family cysteine protease
MINNLKFGTGWLRDYHDIRDYTTKSPKVAPLLKSSYIDIPNLGIPNLTTRPEYVDLRKNCSPIRSQGRIGSCVSFAVLGSFEYFQRKVSGSSEEMSPLFLYKITRNTMNLYHDSGSTVRATIGALSMFGACLEKNWAYIEDWVDEEPGPFQYAQAQNYKSLVYYRLDPPNIDKNVLLENIKTNLSKGIPIIAGFTLYPSFYYADSTGIIPEVGLNEQSWGGHSISIFGFSDEKQRLIVRNSWGEGWGDKGYCYLPYSYVTSGIMSDFWSIIKTSWVSTKDFTTES